MKSKIIVAVATMAIIVGFSAINALAWGGWMYNSNVSTEFCDDVSAIEKEIFIDQTELNALVVGENPDGQRARELSENIVNKQLVLEDKFKSSGYGNRTYICSR